MITRLRNFLAFKRHYEKNLPLDRRHSDLFLLSFPSTGVTWLSHIIANINVIKSGLDHSVTFYNYRQFVPDIHYSRDISDLLTSYPGFRIIKSHSTFNPYYKNNVYLIRNPNEVLRSYYRFDQHYGNYKYSYVDFVKDKQFGIDAWVRHVQSWLGQKYCQVHLLTYEGLCNDINVELLNLFNNIGMNVDEEILNTAIELSNIENMRKSEQDYYNNSPGYKYEFVASKYNNQDIDLEAAQIISEATLGVYEEILHVKYNADFTLK